MKRIPLILVLSLVFVWWYTSWYWYTCNIKNACETPNISSQVPLDSRTIWEDEVNNNDSQSLQSSVSNTTNTWEINDREVPRLSASDVLVWESFVPQVPQTREQTSTWSDSQNQDISQTQDEAQETGTWTSRDTPEINIEVNTDTSTDLCVSPLVWPISIGWANDASQVEKLEAFLIANAYLWASDGVYSDADLQAVKQLQLDYKQQMLDPWGIDSPTWYVGTTTVATINSIWCKN